MKKIIHRILLVILVLGTSMLSIHAYAQDNIRIGVRGTVDSESVDGEDFDKYELFVDFPLPWQWQWGEGWTLATRLYTAAGSIEADSKSAFIGSLVPTLRLRRQSWPISLDIGSGPTFIGRDRFGDADLGGQFHFTSHFGITAWIADWSFGYRIQHVSNASIESVNPGLDTHMFELAYSF